MPGKTGLSSKQRSELLWQILLRERSIGLSDYRDQLKAKDLRSMKAAAEELGKKHNIKIIRGPVATLIDSWSGTHKEQMGKQTDAKIRIAKETVAEFVNDDDSILLGPGTTMKHIAEQVVLQKKGVTVLTSNLAATQVLIHGAFAKIRVHILGQIVEPNIGAVVPSSVAKEIGSIRHEIIEFRPQKIIMGGYYLDSERIYVGQADSLPIYAAIVDSLKSVTPSRFILACTIDKLDAVKAKRQHEAFKLSRIKCPLLLVIDRNPETEEGRRIVREIKNRENCDVLVVRN